MTKRYILLWFLFIFMGLKLKIDTVSFCHESGCLSPHYSCTSPMDYNSHHSLHTHSHPPLHQSHSCHQSLINPDCFTTPAPHSHTHTHTYKQHTSLDSLRSLVLPRLTFWAFPLYSVKVFSGWGDRWLGQWDACILHPEFRGVFLRHELYLWLVIVIFLGTWNLQSQEVLSLGTTPLQPVRCCLAKEGCLWVGYWNKVYLISVKIRKIEVGLGWKRCHWLFILYFTTLTHSRFSLFI